jgi:hypothetical protein
MTNIEKYLEHYSNEKDSGAIGKAFECAIREYLSGRAVKGVKAQGKMDAYVTFRCEGKRSQVTVEVKTACGEIEMADRSQFIIYCPEVTTDCDAETQGFVFTRQEWREFIGGYTGRGSFVRTSSRGHVHIQSFRSEGRPKASKPIADYIWAVCGEMPTVEEWIEELRG